MNNAIKDKMKESHNELLNMLKLFCEHILRQREQAANLSTHTPEPSRRFNSICYDDDDDDEERTITLRDIISQLPPSFVITTSPLILPIEDPKDSLIMGNKDLSTILEKESDKFIKSSVEDLVPISSESKDTFGSDKENVKIYSNPLFEFDDEYISSDANPLFDEVLEDTECKVSYDSSLDELTFLVTYLFDSNEDGYFTPGDDVELLLHRDPSTPIMSVVSILEGFIDEPPLEGNDDLFNLECKENKWKKILYDAPIDDLMSEDKVFDPGIHDQIFSLTYVSLPFEIAIIFSLHMLFEFFFLISLIRWILLFFSPLEMRILFLTLESPLFIFLIGVELS
nr:hypothetical protein [Tanacetum cinerariifolium]